MLAVGFVHCAHAAPYTVADRLAQFGAAARARLGPAFRAAHVPYPPRELTLIAFKQTKRLEVYARGATGPWRFIRSFPVQAASGVLGPKLRVGDNQVPEGIYRIELLNPNSRFHVSLRLNYPNAFDRDMARRDGRKDLGGDIMIHGNAVSIGCLAIGDRAAEDLFTLVADVGANNAKVIVAPVDFRTARGFRLPAGIPAWGARLYQGIANELNQYPPGG